MRTTIHLTPLIEFFDKHGYFGVEIPLDKRERISIPVGSGDGSWENGETSKRGFAPEEKSSCCYTMERVIRRGEAPLVERCPICNAGIMNRVTYVPAPRLDAVKIP
jgi:hypothetical protein